MCPNYLRIPNFCCTFVPKNVINRALVAKNLEKCIIMATKENKQEQKKVSKFWEACQKFKGAFVINDPAFVL